MSSKITSADLISEYNNRNENIRSNRDFERDECFQKWDRTFGFYQETYNMFWLLLAHLGVLSIFICDLSTISLGAVVFAFLYGYFGGFGVTVGCHRYWTHRTFKATLPLQILLMIMQTVAVQYPIFKWSMDHRIHHKYTDTNADPHNATRGFWFSHMLWLVLPKHKEFKNKQKTFDMRDLENDPIVRFQSQYYFELMTFFAVIVPVAILHWGFGASWYNSLVLNLVRIVVIMHISFCVNSFAHLWGDKPYDKNIIPTEAPFVSLLAGGEGFHNFHHTFPQDYRTSEFGWRLNVSTMFIDFFAKIGWAYDLKTVSEEAIKKRMMRTGNLKNFDAKINGLHNSQEPVHPNFQSKLICTAQSD